ncbi:MAG: hypothetical protein JWM11_4119, partial [Planctomycetaceae bacterium]|nr:hypothetical protein [Planctomycetaceae bacterium]
MRRLLLGYSKLGALQLKLIVLASGYAPIAGQVAPTTSHRSNHRGTHASQHVALGVCRLEWTDRTILFNNDKL